MVVEEDDVQVVDSLNVLVVDEGNGAGPGEDLGNGRLEVEILFEGDGAARAVADVIVGDGEGNARFANVTVRLLVGLTVTLVADAATALVLDGALADELVSSLSGAPAAEQTWSAKARVAFWSASLHADWISESTSSMKPVDWQMHV